ncbi:MAG: VOC family protein [Phenylobacterium sp.]|nr:VOC family protein [Phenylobacterium sp.]
MPQIHPCLWFDGQAEEAMGFYVSVFPSSKILKVARLPDGAVLTVEAELDGARFVALNGGPQFPHSEAVSFVIPCADQGEVDHYWDLLVEGGQPSQCGWLKDRFGVSWQVVPVELHALLADPKTAAKASAVMLSQIKLDIDAIKAAVG